jgi:pilus assembly protein CpaE
MMSEARLTLVEPSGAYAVAVVDDDPKLRTRLAMQLGEAARAASFPSLEAMEERFPPGDPMVVVFGPTYATPHGLAAVERLTRERPEVGAVLVVEELSTQTLQAALRAGVRDVALVNDTTQLVEAVDRVADALNVVVRRPAVPTAEGGAGPLGRVITVFSTKGGAGKSVVASNLAVLLARRSPRPVVLVDADLQFGDVAVMLKLTPQHTIVDAVSAMGRLDAQLLQSLLIRHGPSGLLVLPAPLEPAFADQVSAGDLAKIVQILQTFCAYVVIDTPAQFNDVVLNLLEITDDILLVAGMDIPNIKNVKLGLQTLRLLNTPMTKIKLILNRANSKVKLDVGEVERALQVKADVLIPSDIVVPQSVNKGVPAVLDAPKSGVARAMQQLAEQIAAASPASAAR